MTRHRRCLLRSLSAAAVVGLVMIPAGAPALAQSSARSEIAHRQSVLTELSPTGEVGTSRVFTQLTVQGSGEITVELPEQSTSGLRNLEGFGRPAVDGDTVRWSVAATPEGATRRSVADHTGEHPVTIGVTYRLDGEDIEPDALVGRSGVLTVTFDIRNVTGRTQDVTVYDGQGRPSTEPMEVPVPMVASVATTLDSRFLVTEAPGGKIVGDGRGNTVIDWLLVMFSPIGSEEQTFSYTARVTDAVVAPTTATFVPVHAGSFPSLRTSQDSYAAARDGLRDLTNGALIIDSNVKLLGSGAAQLLDGLVQLRDGASQLAEGLGTTAAPGAQELSDGMGRARTGGRELATGLGDLSSGAGRLSEGLSTARGGGGQLAAGMGDLRSGANRLSDGLAQARGGASDLSAGLTDQIAPGARQLAQGLQRQAAPGSRALADGLSSTAAPGASQLAQGLADEAVPGAEEIRGGIQGLRAGVGEPSHAPAEGTVLGGLNGIAEGLSDTALPGVDALRRQQSNTDDCDISAGQVADCGIEQLARAVAAGQVAAIPGLADQLAAFGAAFADAITAQGMDPTDRCVQVVVGAQALQGALGTDAQTAAAAIFGANAAAVPTIVPACLSALKAHGSALGLDDLRAGLLTAVGGLQQILQGLSNDGCDRDEPTDPGNPCGVREVLQLLDAGVGRLVTGLEAAADGAAALAGGLADAATGAEQLATGIAGAASGADQLSDGVDTAAAGSRQLTSGLVQLDDGGRELASGAGRAASGARDLSSGLAQLDDGGRELASGAGRAATGGNDLANGLVQLDDGAGRLAAGLGDAADGSEQIADGLVSAADGGEQIADGTVQLSEAGMGALIDGTTEAAATPSRLLELANAANDRGRAGDGLPYGTVAGADASAVFRYELAGLGTGTDEGPSTALQALIVLVAFGVAAAVGIVLRRRFI